MRQAIDGRALEIEIHGERRGDIDAQDVILQFRIPQNHGRKLKVFFRTMQGQRRLLLLKYERFLKHVPSNFKGSTEVAIGP